MIQDRIRYIQSQMPDFPATVYLGFSGGKDSSAVVKLIYTAVKTLRTPAPCRFVAVYCDTGVENPVIDRFAKQTLLSIKEEAAEERIPFDCQIIEPELNQSFFVRLVGRGYPPPTNSFRWCTTDIRIRPFQRFLRSRKEQTLIAIGTRMGESKQRDRSLSKSVDLEGDVTFYQRQREGFPKAVLFTPIIDFDVGDVWEALISLEYPRGISATALAKLYKDGSGECPTVRDFKDKPCSKARFGCWVCTVVRRDRSAERMIDQGYDELAPYLRFRQWLLDIRNLQNYRCSQRRNGKPGMGPFNLRARRAILEAVDRLEVETGQAIITARQRARIFELWEDDRPNPAMG